MLSSTQIPAAEPSQWALLRRILAYAWQYRWRLALAMFLTLLGAGVSLVLPLGIRTLLNDALAAADRPLLHRLGAALLGLFLLRAVAGFFGTYVAQVTGQRMVVDLRRRLYDHFQQLDLGFFFHRRVGDLVSRLHNDTSSMQQAVTSLVSSASVNIFKLAGAVVMMVVLDPLLSLIVLLMAPAATLLSRHFGNVMHKVARQVQDRLGQAAAISQEALSEVQLVQTYGRGRYESGRYGNALAAFFDVARREARANAFFMSLLGFLTVVSTIAIFWYGGSQVFAGRLQVGDVVAFLFYSQMISQTIGVLAELYGAASRMTGASVRVFELLDAEPAVADPPDGLVLARVRGHIELDRVSVCYSEEGGPVLHQVSFEVEPGQTVALVGPSGSGKSTLLRLLPRLLDPSSGCIRLDGHDLRQVGLDSLRSQFAVVSQEVQLFATTVRENIRYGRLEATDEAVALAAQRANAHDFIAGLAQGYDTEVGEGGVRLSGGQRQRLAIARALLRDAPILILDEATSSVDSASEATIQRALDELRRTRTTLIAAHRLSTVLHADRIVVIDGGRVIDSGCHEDLMSRQGLYRQLARQHFRGHEHPALETVA